jgi:hypothetical protein
MDVGAIISLNKFMTDAVSIKGSANPLGWFLHQLLNIGCPRMEHDSL